MPSRNTSVRVADQRSMDSSVAALSVEAPRPTDDPPTHANPSGVLRNLRSAGVAVAVLVGLFLAITGSANADTASAPVSATQRSVAASDLLTNIVATDGVRRGVGGYVPGVGVVLTLEVDELAVTDIDSWARRLVEPSGPLLADLGEEKVVLVLDIARPNRVSRLVSLAPNDLDTTGAMRGAEAPAVSTAPLQVDFDDAPGG